ncbi:MAG: hypothetical protein WCK73_01925 [Deltaproteobacteria bacterium]
MSKRREVEVEEEVPEEITVVEVSVTPPAAAPPPAAPSSPVLARLLRMADAYRRSGAPHQAMEMYFELVEEHGETPEGILSRERLMAICEQYEQEGKMRQARSLYERLL